MLKNPLRLIGEITYESYHEILYFIKINIRYMLMFVEIILPYCMYIIGQNLVVIRGGIKVGGEITIPVLCLVTIYYIREALNKSGDRGTIPVPGKRFTRVDEDGEVTINSIRLHELLLYTSELEDYLERKGLLREERY